MMAEPLPYAVPVRRARHDTIYTALLGAMSFLLLIATGDMFFLKHHLPTDLAWVLGMAGFLYLSLLVFSVAVLLIRLVWPAYRKWVTVSLNVVLLIVIPFGTAFGVYGLWKVDKETSAA